MIPAWRFFLGLFLSLGCFWAVPFRAPASLYVCRFAVALFAAKLLLDRLVGSSEQEANVRICSGKCLHCGYDMRATLARCPECGQDVREALDEYVPDKLIDS